MKVFITKYAMSSGIREGEADPPDSLGRVVERYLGASAYRAPGDWYPTPEAAVARARTMRDLEIASLRRQIERLETLVFEVGV